jgi:glycosyltransferase involved in cell wall biosynthesis
MDARLLGSVIVPAHNEERVIGRCLDSLLLGFDAGELEIVVVCNGCQDRTAEVARAFGPLLEVIELETASKTAALRAGDAAVRAFPRLYLDADVTLSAGAARRLLRALALGAIAARPPICYDTDQSSAFVRSYYRARSRMPAVLGSLWGAGVYGLSAAGRARFGEFPDVTADDLWLDWQFAPEEIQVIDSDPVVVTVPRNAGGLMRILRRTYRGKAQNRTSTDRDARSRETTRGAVGDLGRLLASGPAAAGDAVTYAAFAVGARLALAVRSAPAGTPSVAWERDESSRTAR